MTSLAILGIKLFRKLVTPYAINSCRYTPTCSEYAIEALKRYGFLKGTMLGGWRILRCNPISRGGFDPVR